MCRGEAEAPVGADPSAIGRIEITDRRIWLRQFLLPPPFVSQQLGRVPTGNADVHHDRTLRHLWNDRADAVFGQALGKAEVRGVRIVGVDQIDAETRQITRCGAAFDVERCDAQLEEPPRQLVLHDRAGADVCIVDDQFVRCDSRRHAIAVRDGLERVVTGHHRVDAERAGRWVRVKLTDRAGEQLQRALNRRQIRGTGFTLRGWLLGRQAGSVIGPTRSSPTPRLAFFEEGGEVLLSAIQCGTMTT